MSEKSVCACGGKRCGGKSGKWIWLILAVAVVGVLIAKSDKKKAVTPVSGVPSVALSEAASGKGLPRLVDLGAGKCMACKMMTPVLEDLRTNFVDKLDVQFIDVWENPEAGKSYGISIIPTQIFFDADGKELFRHEGFFSKADILEKWKVFGVELTGEQDSGVRSQESEVRSQKPE